MTVKAENLGYRELDRLACLMQRIVEEELFYSFINDSRHEVIIGYDLKYDDVYLENECGKFYPADFE